MADVRQALTVQVMEALTTKGEARLARHEARKWLDALDLRDLNLPQAGQQVLIDGPRQPLLRLTNARGAGFIVQAITIPEVK